jgi:hypothetical protein
LHARQEEDRTELPIPTLTRISNMEIPANSRTQERNADVRRHFSASTTNSALPEVRPRGCSSLQSWQTGHKKRVQRSRLSHCCRPKLPAHRRRRHANLFPRRGTEQATKKIAGRANAYGRTALGQRDQSPPPNIEMERNPPSLLNSICRPLLRCPSDR